MKIFNKTSGKYISKDAKECKSILSRMRGLMLAKKPKTVVLMNPKINIEGASIHMFFMRFPIDVIWVNEKGTVVDVFRAAKPWALKIYRPKLSAKYVVESPIGMIDASETKEGDIIKFN